MAVLLLAFAIPLATTASGETWHKPSAGSFYLYNEAHGQFLAVGSDGNLYLSDNGEQITITQDETDKATDSYTLTANKGNVYTTFQGEVHVGTSSADDIQSRWMFKPVDGKSNVYTICCRDNTANAASFIYYSALTGGIAKTYAEPSAAGQWKLMGQDDMMQVVTLDETADTYTTPTLQSGVASASVHLRRTFTPNSWNSLCLPFAVSNEQLKKQFGDGVEVVKFSKYKDNTLYCNDVTDIEAGVSYLIYIPEATLTNERDYYEFTGVTAFADNPSPTESNGVTFVGSFERTTAPMGATILRKNLVYTLGKPTPMKGMRAYFAQTAQSATVAPIMLWSIGDTPTGIDQVFVGGRTVDIYSVDGVLVRSQATSAKGLPRGVYVVDGQKFTVNN